MDPQELAALYAKCEQTLQRYINEARRMCGLLNEFKAEPLNRNLRTEITRQRRRENNAQFRYAKVRQQLFEAARRGSVVSNHSRNKPAKSKYFRGP